MSNPSNPSWTGACLHGNLRLLSPRLFAMGRGWRRGPSSHGQSATATRSDGNTLRRAASRGVPRQTGEPSGRPGATASAETTHNPDNFSGEALLQHFGKGAAILGWTQNAPLGRRGCRETSPPASPSHQNINTCTKSMAATHFLAHLFVMTCVKIKMN